MTTTTPELAPPLQTSTTDLQGNRVSNLEPSGPKAENLQLGHRGLSSDLKNLKEESPIHRIPKSSGYNPSCSVPWTHTKWEK
ncbi:hypothetical protein AVEN_259561-1 [Araneus ventricosus]|uniref:Uncharacterized protein n=1 Tax=Araneus ventricosus TaxID=182803 RepID=A0A4Y2EQR6_ARAVE|nr:hypothetical protein AVEN_259561-1 [Araneus ventricosus]